MPVCLRDLNADGAHHAVVGCQHDDPVSCRARFVVPLLIGDPLLGDSFLVRMRQKRPGGDSLILSETLNRLGIGRVKLSEDEPLGMERRISRHMVDGTTGAGSETSLLSWRGAAAERRRLRRLNSA